MAASTQVMSPLRSSAVALSFILSGSAAYADVTAGQVWTDWQSYMSIWGYEISGDESRDGDTLTVSDITMVTEIPEEDGILTLTLSEITFTENGDGTVSVGLPDPLPMMFDLQDDEGAVAQVMVDYRSTGFDMQASGDPDDILYAYTADELGLVLDQVIMEGEPADPGTMRMTLTDVEGSSRMVTGDMRESDQSFTAGSMSYAIDITDPEEEEGRAIIDGGTGPIGFEARARIPRDMDSSNMAAAISAGFDTETRLTYEAGATEFKAIDEDETIEGQSSSDSGEFLLTLGEAGLTYALSTKGLGMRLAGGELPFPVDFAMEESGVTLTMPVMAAPEPQDFALGLRMAGFTMSDAIWAQFDPEGRLPRDPATVDIETSGSAELAVDLLDPEAMERLEDGETLPGDLNALDLDALVLRALGAQLTGQGSFTFDNSDMQTFNGFPAPDGSVDLRLEGVNGLIDTLIAMGYLPQDQAMGLRMMMGMFAVPGEGEDVLTSTIRVTPDGQVLANGQRLR